tara:strand:- start:1615 stop:2421 length:807 start_codon:yes stop_codon:yes gene_type:complete
MAYVGNPQAAAFSSRPSKQDLTGASGTSLTLSHAVANAESIDLFINNVRQEPTTAYSVSDTTVTLTGSVVATDDIYVVYNSLALQESVPPDGSVGSAKIANSAITDAKIDTMAASKLTGAMPAISGASLTNLPRPSAVGFLARRNGAGLAISNVIMPFDSVSINGGFDTNSGYNTSTYTYTVQVAGLYWFHVSSILGSAAIDNGQWKIQLNSSDYEQRHFTNKTTEWWTHSIDTYINASVNDTVRVKMSSSTNMYGNQWSVFMGHLIG